MVRLRCWAMPRIRCIPTGSNGASQAIRMRASLAGQWSSAACRPPRLRAYDDQLCGPMARVALRNRGAGPFGLLGMVGSVAAASSTPLTT